MKGKAYYFIFILMIFLQAFIFFNIIYRCYKCITLSPEKTAEIMQDIKDHQEFEVVAQELTMVDGHYMFESYVYGGKQTHVVGLEKTVYIKGENGDFTTFTYRDGEDNVKIKLLKDGYTKPSLVEVKASNKSKYALNKDKYNFVEYYIYLPTLTTTDGGASNDELCVPSKIDLWQDIPEITIEDAVEGHLNS